ncbi:hypothetical protein CANARDRAFT_198662 [[Candida] arabinofermentans NRRL YB-2248]|uniref:TRUD domain-containing protein n=1 Tax=[Candida] arabinofermentans NRRL YB-2248 TaxID=983967 RepID=A0A1E4T1B0_9ASCO|nr:hypothetical protein CANARDRAFT_198662 [[Candida] arabinofermentans NRRL YB-2248]
MTDSTDLKRSLDDTTVVDNDQETKRVKVEEPQAGITEAEEEPVGTTEPDVGITECIYKGNGRITGTLKQRYTDFMVNEIDMNGNVVHLNDLGFYKPKDLTPEEAEKFAEKPKEEIKEEIEKEEEESKPVLQDFRISDEHKSKLIEIFGESDTEKILELFKEGKNVESEKAFDDKEDRTKIHQLLREIFKNKVDAMTTTSNHFQIGLNNRNRPNKKRRQREQTNLPPIEHNLGPQKNYIHLSIYKENKETMEVAGLLSKLLSIPTKWIKYAGTKDRRGVTVQRASIENLSVERINKLNRQLRGFQIGGFEYSDSCLNLGDLQGNEFIITIKDVKPVDPSLTIEEAVVPILESLGTNGFINYYGMQRFGTFSISTHEIGKQVLNSNWKAAAELILSEQKIVIPGSIEARKIWAETKDAGLALKKMPRKCSAEYSILSRLDKCDKTSDGDYSDNSYFNAIMGIPRNLRIMYGHAYQSYVWNTVASRRIQLFGLEVVAGDLVLVDNDKDKKDVVEEVKIVKEFDVNNEDFEEDVKKDSFVRARPVTDEEARSKKFDIHDIVLPSPGFDVIYPENEVLRNAYVEVMAKDGLDPFKMSRKVKEFSLSGSYRNVVSKVKGLSYEFRNYEKATEPLVRTDLELYRMRYKAMTYLGETDPQPERILEGTPGAPNTALILKLQLGVSTYATMALRELIKGDTSRYGDVVSLRTTTKES